MLLRAVSVLPADEAVAEIKAAVDKAYGKRGRTIVERNFAAIDAALANLVHVQIPNRTVSSAPLGTVSLTPPRISSVT